MQTRPQSVRNTRERVDSRFRGRPVQVRGPLGARGVGSTTPQVNRLPSNSQRPLIGMSMAAPTPGKSPSAIAEEIAHLEALAETLRVLPVLDSRPIDEILGYDDDGAF